MKKPLVPEKPSTIVYAQQISTFIVVVSLSPIFMPLALSPKLGLGS